MRQYENDEYDTDDVKSTDDFYTYGDGSDDGLIYNPETHRYEYADDGVSTFAPEGETPPF